jgi:hypothetical protein
MDQWKICLSQYSNVHLFRKWPPANVTLSACCYSIQVDISDEVLREENRTFKVIEISCL